MLSYGKGVYVEPLNYAFPYVWQCYFEGFQDEHDIEITCDIASRTPSYVTIAFTVEVELQALSRSSTSHPRRAAKYKKLG